MDTRAQRIPQQLADRGSDGIARPADGSTMAVLPKAGSTTTEARRAPCATAAQDKATLPAGEPNDAPMRASVDPMRATDRYRLARTVEGLLG